MAVSLRQYLNTELKKKGMTAKEAKKNAGKYKSIAAAKKAGSLYYTNKAGKVMAAVYAEDLKKPIRPKLRPKKSGSSSVIPPSGNPKKGPGKSGRPGTITVTKLPPARKNKPVDEQPTTNPDMIVKFKEKYPDSDERGKRAMKFITRDQWLGLNKSERRALGLPASPIAGSQHPLKDFKFKGGGTFTGK